MPDTSNVGGMTVLLRPLDCFVLRLTSGEHVVRVILNYEVGDVSTLFPTFGTGLDVHDCHLSLLVSTVRIIASLSVAAERPLILVA
jgi:hypothetical protein